MTPDSLTVVTWNVLIATDDAETRARACLQTLHATAPDIIAIQECHHWFMDGVAPELDYHCTSPGDRAPAGALALWSRFPIRAIERHVFRNSHVGRVLLLAELDLGDRSLVVANVHLDSHRTSSEPRAGELREAFERLYAWGADDRLLLGDMNFDDGWEPETSAIDPSYVDVWPAVSDEPGLTWDPTRNDRAFGVPLRIDRMLLSSSKYRPTIASLLATEAVQGTFPSDHFALFCEFES